MQLRYAGIAILLAAGVSLAQQNPQPQAAQPVPPVAAQAPQGQMQPAFAPRPAQPPRAQPRPQMQPRPGMQQQPRPALERALGGPPGKWWDRPELVQKLLITSDQQKKMDDVFQQSRLRLIDLNASLEKESLILEPLVSAETPEEAKIVAQIDKVAQARAELEKANARMLLGIRRILTQDQWNKLKAETGGPNAGGNAPQPQPRPAAAGPNGGPNRGPGGPPQGRGPARGPGGPGGNPPPPREE